MAQTIVKNLLIDVRANDNASGTLKATQSNVIRFVGSITAAIAALGSIAFPATAAIEFERSLVDVRKTTAFTTTEMERLGKAIQGMSKNMAVGQNELAAIAATAGQLGVGGKGVDAVIAFTQSVARASITFGVAEEKVAELGSQLLNIFNLDVNETENVFSLINELSNNSVASAGGLLDIMRRVGNVAGLTAVQVGALASSTADFGVTSEVAGTTLVKFFSNMESKSKDFARILNISQEEWIQTLEEDGIGAFKSVLTVLSEMGSAARATNISELFGTGRIFSLATKFVNDASNGFVVLDKQIRNATAGFDGGTSSIEEYNRVAESTSFTMKTLANSFSVLATNAGEQLLKPINVLARQLTDLFNSEGAAAFANNVVASIRSGIDAVQRLATAAGDAGLTWVSLFNGAKALVLLFTGKAILSIAKYFVGIGAKAIYATQSINNLRDAANGFSKFNAKIDAGQNPITERSTNPGLLAAVKRLELAKQLTAEEAKALKASAENEVRIKSEIVQLEKKVALERQAVAERLKAGEITKGQARNEKAQITRDRRREVAPLNQSFNGAASLTIETEAYAEKATRELAAAKLALGNSSKLAAEGLRIEEGGAARNTAAVTANTASTSLMTRAKNSAAAAVANLSRAFTLVNTGVRSYISGITLASVRTTIFGSISKVAIGTTRALGVALGSLFGPVAILTYAAIYALTTYGKEIAGFLGLVESASEEAERIASVRGAKAAADAATERVEAYEKNLVQGMEDVEAKVEAIRERSQSSSSVAGVTVLDPQDTKESINLLNQLQNGQNGVADKEKQINDAIDDNIKKREEVAAAIKKASEELSLAQAKEQRLLTAAANRETLKANRGESSGSGGRTANAGVNIDRASLASTREEISRLSESLLTMAATIDPTTVEVASLRDSLAGVADVSAQASAATETIVSTLANSFTTDDIPLIDTVAKIGVNVASLAKLTADYKELQNEFNAVPDSKKDEASTLELSKELEGYRTRIDALTKYIAEEKSILAKSAKDKGNPENITSLTNLDLNVLEEVRREIFVIGRNGKDAGNELSSALFASVDRYQELVKLSSKLKRETRLAVGVQKRLAGEVDNMASSWNAVVARSAKALRNSEDLQATLAGDKETDVNTEIAVDKVEVRREKELERIEIGLGKSRRQIDINYWREKRIRANASFDEEIAKIRERGDLEKSQRSVDNATSNLEDPRIKQARTLGEELRQVNSLARNLSANLGAEGADSGQQDKLNKLAARAAEIKAELSTLNVPSAAADSEALVAAKAVLEAGREKVRLLKQERAELESTPSRSRDQEARIKSINTELLGMVQVLANATKGVDDLNSSPLQLIADNALGNVASYGSELARINKIIKDNPGPAGEEVRNKAIEERSKLLATINDQTAKQQALQEALVVQEDKLSKSSGAGAQGVLKEVSARILRTQATIEDLKNLALSASNQGVNDLQGRSKDVNTELANLSKSVGGLTGDAAASVKVLLDRVTETTKLVDEARLSNADGSFLAKAVKESEEALKNLKDILFTMTAIGNGNIRAPFRDLTATEGSFATGGYVSGPGTGTSDSIFAKLSNGEYVIKAAAVKRYGLGTLNAINGMQLPKFAAGGPVGAGSGAGGSSIATTGSNEVNLNINMGGSRATLRGEKEQVRNFVDIINAIGG